MEKLEIAGIQVELDTVPKDRLVWSPNMALGYVYDHRNIFDDRTYRNLILYDPPVVLETSLFQGEKYFFIWAFLPGKILFYHIGKVSRYKLNKIKDKIIQKVREEAGKC